MPLLERLSVTMTFKRIKFNIPQVLFDYIWSRHKHDFLTSKSSQFTFVPNCT